MSGEKETRPLGIIRGFDPTPSIHAGVDALEALGAPYALIGGVALGVWGIERATKDVDFAVPVGWAEKAADRFADLESRPLRIGGVAVRSPTIKIDFIDRRFYFKKLYREAIDEAGRSGRGARAGDRVVRVVSLEYLLAMKMVSGEPKDDQDAHRILELESLDYTRAREIVSQHMSEATANRLDAFARAAGRPEVERKRLYKNGDDPRE